MPNSFAQTLEFTCPQCPKAFDADLWLIMDVVEPKFAPEVAP